MPSNTPYLDLLKPDVGQKGWGAGVNANADTLDAKAQSVDAAIAAEITARTTGDAATLAAAEAYTNAHASGSLNPVTKTSAYVAVANDAISCDTSAAGFTITIPSAAANAGKQIIVKKISSDSNVVTLVPTGTDTLEADTSITFSGQNISVTLTSNGASGWLLT